MMKMIVWCILLLSSQSFAISFNQPKFCANASWNSYATTFANRTEVGEYPFDIFITTNNDVYVPNRSRKQIIKWINSTGQPIESRAIDSHETRSVFVTETNEAYFDYSWNSNRGIRKLTSNLSNETLVIDLWQGCYDLFIDIYNNIYCSMNDYNQVIKKSLHNELDRIKIVAGTGVTGSNSYMLNNPNGIFVDDDLNLYVADHDNDRIQLFRSGQLHGIAVAGDKSITPTITLTRPTAVVVDGNNYLFIVDFGVDRIVISGSYGFRCILGCNGEGSEANELNNPRSMAFDSLGNIYVADDVNHRIQKLSLMSNSCSEIIPSNITTSNQSNLMPMTNTTNDISYHVPKFNPLTLWNPNGITFADNNTIGPHSYSMFIDRNNTIYVATRQIQRILIWENDSITPTITINADVSSMHSIFVTSNGDIYTVNKMSTWQINKWKSNTNDSTVVTYLDGESFGLFVDVNNTLYISLRDRHKVITQSLNGISNILTIVAGTGSSGNASNMLNKPHGIFVDINFDLYVADSQNNRIQLFRAGSSDAINIAGIGSKNNSITLNDPSAVVLDVDKYLFIVDYGNHRIVRTSSHGFQCIIGCTRSSNSTSNMLYKPTTMAFDSYQNIYVVDEFNHRIQKFLRLNYTNITFYNQPKFCGNATWFENATTFTNESTIGNEMHALFIDKNNSIYTVNHDNGQIHVWLNGSVTSTVILNGNASKIKSIFVTKNGDIYVDNFKFNGHVDKFTLNSNNSISVMSVPTNCYGLFVDIADNLYCSANHAHQVFKKWLGDNSTISSRVAGSDSKGSDRNMLNEPNGIFVDTNFDLYVADHLNNRIIVFGLGKIFGKVVADNLNRPVDVILDDNKYLYITEHYNHRIIVSGPSGSRCIVGCTDTKGSTADKLSYPRSIAFDSFGNLFVVDCVNNRIQKFAFMRSFCDETITLTIDANGALIVPKCSRANTIGIRCNISATVCDLSSPCENQGTCINTDENIYGYRCEYDHQICKSNTCWNNGTCNATSNTTFECSCQSGWTGEHCETMINYCHGVTCRNNGVCRPVFMNYVCECLGDSFSGRHCEKVSTKITVLRYFSKSVGYIAIIFLICTALFFVIMDIMKYIFGIDLTKHEFERMQKEKNKKKLHYRSTKKRTRILKTQPKIRLNKIILRKL